MAVTRYACSNDTAVTSMSSTTVRHGALSGCSCSLLCLCSPETACCCLERLGWTDLHSGGAWL
jgi:hypothetical protein